MEDGIFFNQSKYIKEMLKKFGLEDSKPTKTPMSTEIKLTKDDEADSVDSSKYRGMIGSLLYLTASRPDIMFSVCLCARFQENPKTTHLEAVKRIFRYIRGTSHLGLWYPKGTRIETIVYADSDHAGDYVDRKSTSGVCTFMGCCLTSWFTKKQTALAISTTEAEYVSAGKACQQALWMKQALIDYGIRLDDVPIMCDNKGAIDLSKNPVQHSRTKHIEIRHHFLRDNVQKGNISIECSMGKTRGCLSFTRGIGVLLLFTFFSTNVGTALVVEVFASLCTIPSSNLAIAFNHSGWPSGKIVYGYHSKMCEALSLIPASNYGVICEDETKRRDSGAKTKTFEENLYLLPYAVSSKEDTAYQRQLITRIRGIFSDSSSARRDISNLDELCKTEEFTAIRYLMGLDEEFVAVGPSKISTVERTPGSMFTYGGLAANEIDLKINMAYPLPLDTAYRSSGTESLSIEEVMVDKGKKSSMETFAPNDKADYYSGIKSITVNGKNAYELKGKFLDDLHNNAFSGTNGKDAKIGGDEIEVSDDESSDLEEYWSDKEETTKIFKIKTDVFNYETPLCLAFNEFNYLLKDLDDSELKYKALRNKAIMKGLISDAMIVGKDGRAMRFTTKVMIKGNMKTKLMKNDMNYVVSELTRCQSAK
ncbi:hypothetical protein Tco_1439762 [Tanacetum coccineum]